VGGEGKREGERREGGGELSQLQLSRGPLPPPLGQLLASATAVGVDQERWEWVASAPESPGRAMRGGGRRWFEEFLLGRGRRSSEMSNNPYLKNERV
jgi:hypothetical protein